MNSVKMCVGTDDQIRNGARWPRLKSSAGLGLLSAAEVTAIGPLGLEYRDPHDDPRR
jgi:hypothetical protein